MCNRRRLGRQDGRSHGLDQMLAPSRHALARGFEVSSIQTVAVFGGC
jgi:hypothetical protein